MKRSRIAGTGGYLPEKVLSNSNLEQMVDTSDQWILERTGISNRHIMADHETTSSMAENAARKAFEVAGLNPEDVELILVATATPDRTFPSTACILQNRLGAFGCPALDVGAACAGFIYGLSIADQYIKNGVVKNALVIGAESLSRIVDWTDRSTCVLFGDGAGAVVLEATDEPGILSTHIHANGYYNDLLYAGNRIGELKEPAYIKMQGNEVFKIAVKTLGDIVDETLAYNNIDQSEIDWLIPHQANLRIITATAKKLNLPMERVILTVQDHGNTSAASIPLALDKGVRDKRIKRGEMILLEAFGAGLTWGSALIKY
ncbi:MAG: ketoacyl-ACP synthase III [Gammaproteobacteria bacterium]|nr:ketoacyl-ACP synthase III [Gammaproteobacteria bacterium]